MGFDVLRPALKVYAILACVYAIQTNARPEKYLRNYSENQVVEKALQATNTTSPLLRNAERR